MRRLTPLLAGIALSACVTSRPPPAPTPPSLPWDQRAATLQQAGPWQLAGRAAVAVGTQGWQASLDWRQRAADSEIHLSGPLGVGALVITRTAAGVSLNGAPPGDAELGQIQQRLGFELPLDDLRFWLLGVPNPDTPSDVQRNDQDRAKELTQDGWTVDYDRYLPVRGDWLPSRLVLSREGVRVRVVVDHREGPS
jgi:outer membrane lipoprotein LolB